MQKKSLSSYIQEQLGRGFSFETIKSHLLKYGYTGEMVDRAFSEARHEIRHTIHLSKTTLVAVMLLSLGFIIAGASLYFINQAPKAPRQLLDLKVNIMNNEIMQNEKLEFNVELLSLGAIKRYDVALSYIVTDSSNKMISSKTETIALETRASIKSEISLPKNAQPGNYILKVRAEYGGKAASASDTFAVSGPAKDSCFNSAKDSDEEGIDCGGACKPCPTCSDRIKNQGEEGVDCGGPCAPCKKNYNDNNKCTKDLFSDGKCVNEPIEPCCGNLVCEKTESEKSCAEDCQKDAEDFSGMSSSETIERIKQISIADQEKASRLCSGLIQQTFINYCFAEIAQSTKSARFCKSVSDERAIDSCYTKLAELLPNSLLCEEISAEPRKDACYMNFVNKGDYSVCEKISNDYLRKSCEALKNMG